LPGLGGASGLPTNNTDRGEKEPSVEKKRKDIQRLGKWKKKKTERASSINPEDRLGKLRELIVWGKMGVRLGKDGGSMSRAQLGIKGGSIASKL